MRIYATFRKRDFLLSNIRSIMSILEPLQQNIPETEVVRSLESLSFGLVHQLTALPRLRTPVPPGYSQSDQA